MKPFCKEINDNIIRRWLTNPPQCLTTLINGKEVVYAEFAEQLRNERDAWADLAAARAAEIATTKADAERLDWLNDHMSDDDLKNWFWEFENIRDAIDAGRASEGNNHHTLHT